ncbi:hypothetical protein DFH06DRAFT_1241853 [Mycena polygramma]|nr:hypothetical protein DFH06DRAFT_1241853 [Mycena polygramma]
MSKSHVELNEEGGKLFKAGDFRGAARSYLLAIAATDRVYVYFSNLAAAYLKLGIYSVAQDAATKALRLEPRALKARYRRAIARKHIGLVPDAMIDILSVLTTDPSNTEAKAELQILVDIQKKADRRLSPEEILDADEPHAYGSLENPPRANYKDLHQLQLPFFLEVPPPPDNLAKNNGAAALHGACHFCKTPKKIKNLKTCRKCHRVNYCSAECQRAEWPDHKQSCTVARDGNTTIRLGRNLPDHPYFTTHLVFYAVRALGPPKPLDAQHDAILMVVVDLLPMLASGTTSTGKMHVIVKNIVPIPLCIAPDEVVYVHRANRANLQSEGVREPAHSIWIVTTGVYPEGEDCRFRLVTMHVSELITSFAHLPTFSFDLYSHSHGVVRRVNLDLDFLFESINDELRLDVANYYQLQT